MTAVRQLCLDTLLARLVLLAVAALFFFFAPLLPAQGVWGDSPVTRSVSGQFVVTRTGDFSPLLRRPDIAADTNLLRLEPAFLAVSAERFKSALWEELGLKQNGAWSGKIFLDLHPARSTDDPINIRIGPLLKEWNYRLDLPDVVQRQRYARALSAVLLLELANRKNTDASRSAELPPWLADGFARQVLATDGAQILLSSPARTINGVTQSRTAQQTPGWDPLVASRLALRDLAPLTFDQLCWPTDEQLNGADGGIYFANAHLFVSELLALPDGAERLRDLLGRLATCLNWQTAFYAAYASQFKRPLDVEKWWALRMVRFAARDPGPRWTLEVSRAHLASLLAVPVEFRDQTNALPDHGEISLQAALKHFSPDQREIILRLKLRDLELASLRMAQPLASLTDGYRAALADFLGVGRKKNSAPGGGKTSAVASRTTSVSATIRKLDALDLRRRQIETRLDVVPAIGRPNPAPR